MSAEIRRLENPIPSSGMERLWRGLASTALGQVLSFASSTLLVPLFFRAWGADGYGRWLTLTALVSYLTLLDLGGQSYIGNLLANKYVGGKEDEFRRTLSEGVSLFAVVALVALCLLLSVLTIPGLSLPGQKVRLSLDERFILFSMGAAFLLSIPSGVYVTTYRATGLFARATMIGNALQGVFLIVFALALFAGLPPAAYAAAYLSTGIIGTLVVVWDSQRQIAACRRLSLSLASFRAGTAHLGGALYFWVLALANALNQQGIILVLAARGWPAAVAVFATHRTVSGLLGYISNGVRAPVWPELSFLHAQERKDDLARAALLAVRMVVLLTGAAALGLWLLVPFIYPLWTGRQLHTQPTLLALLLFQAVLASGWNTSGWALLASNQHRRLAYSALANALLTIVLAIILAPRFGVLGVAVATLLGDIVCSAAIYPWLASVSFGFPARKMYGAMLSPLFVLIPAGVLLSLIASFIEGWLFVLVGSLIIIGLIYLIMRFTVSQQVEYNWLLGRLRALWRANA